jgi:hypothetical protein
MNIKGRVGQESKILLLFSGEGPTQLVQGERVIEWYICTWRCCRVKGLDMSRMLNVLRGQSSQVDAPSLSSRPRIGVLLL